VLQHPEVIDFSALRAIALHQHFSVSAFSARVPFFFRQRTFLISSKSLLKSLVTLRSSVAASKSFGLLFLRGKFLPHFLPATPSSHHHLRFSAHTRTEVEHLFTITKAKHQFN
jgi:hypothetical protein